MRGVDAQCTFASGPSPGSQHSPGSHSNSNSNITINHSTNTNTNNSFLPDRNDCHIATGAFRGSEPSSTEIMTTDISPELATSPRQRRSSQVFHTSPAAPVPQLSRLIKDGRGKFMFIGDAANLSFLQIIRRIVSESVGSCPFVDDPLRNHMVEVSPEGRPSWISASLSEPPPKPSAAEAQYFLRWYKRATNCILNLYDDAELGAELERWRDGERGGEQDAATSAILYLIFAIGAQTCPEDKDELAERYFNYGRFLTASSVMEDPSLATVRAYILITMYLLGASRRNAAFMYLGIAVRAAYALGIHRGDIGSLFSPAEYTTRERLWRGLRILDLFLSSSLGRPPSTSETRDTTSRENYSATNDLCSIFESILTEVYAKRMVSTEVLERISEQHRRWSSRFAEGLATDDIEPGEYLESTDDSGSLLPNIGLCHLKQSYYWTIMLLSRPFLVESVSRHTSRARARAHADLDDDHDAAPPPSSPSDHLLAHACVDSAIRTVELLRGPLSSTGTGSGVPKRLPFVINSLFVSALVLGLAVLGDLDRVFPLERTLATAQRLLRRLSSHDAVGERDAAIVEHLQGACDAYLERRARRRMERQGLLIGGLFGSVHLLEGGAGAGSGSDHHHPHLREVPPRAVAAGVHQLLSPDTDASADQRMSMGSLGGEGGHHMSGHVETGGVVQMLPAVTDMILPMSPRTLLFDSFDENLPLFPTVDARLIHLGGYHMEDISPDSMMLGQMG